jgi:hypothetical protein
VANRCITFAKDEFLCFDLPDPNVPVPAPGGRARRLQHFWLCGQCSETMVMEQTGDMQIRVAFKSRKVEAEAPVLPGTLALTNL